MISQVALVDSNCMQLLYCIVSALIETKRMGNSQSSLMASPLLDVRKKHEKWPVSPSQSTPEQQDVWRRMATYDAVWRIRMSGLLSLLASELHKLTMLGCC